MDANERAELRRVAEAATPDEWERTPNGRILAWLEPPEDVPGQHAIAETIYGRDAEHIATFDPPTVKRLLDEIEALRAERGR